MKYNVVFNEQSAGRFHKVIEATLFTVEHPGGVTFWQGAHPMAYINGVMSVQVLSNTEEDEAYPAG